jgi:2,4-dienoyl-CoA reductase-like NADH-dependent reductase (Old Yellow Enzyme family)
MSKSSESARPHLFESLRIRGLEIRNRIMVSPMVQYCAQDGLPNDWHLVHLGARAIGGAGIVMTGATAVEPIGRITPHDLGLWNDEQVEGFSRITTFMRELGAAPAIQLAHAGRKASTAGPSGGGAIVPPNQGGWEPVAPSPIPYRPDDPTPRELSLEEITSLIAAFRSAAERAHRAGFEIVEIHAAHGYLLNEFLSPLSNHRTDAYGGGFEKRTKLLLDVVNAVREVWPEELPIFARLSVTEWMEGGWQVDDSIRLAKELYKRGVDLIDCSSGGNSIGQSMAIHPGYQVPLSEAVRRQANIPTAAVGLISDPTMAEEIIANRRADIVALARMMLWNPHWPLHAASALKTEVDLPWQYARSRIFA